MSLPTAPDAVLRVRPRHRRSARRGRLGRARSGVRTDGDRQDAAHPRARGGAVDRADRGGQQQGRPAGLGGAAPLRSGGADRSAPGLRRHLRRSRRAVVRSDHADRHARSGGHRGEHDDADVGGRPGLRGGFGVRRRDLGVQHRRPAGRDAVCGVPARQRRGHRVGAARGGQHARRKPSCPWSRAGRWPPRSCATDRCSTTR